MVTTAAVGIYGKLPSHGDFLQRRVAQEFISVWDTWLQRCVAHSRVVLDDQWLGIYLTSPAWRFFCDAGVCGPQAYAGVLAPSVDRVGRYFPLTLVMQVPQDLTPFTVARGAAVWFAAIEQLVVETLSAAEVDFEVFDAQVQALTERLYCTQWRTLALQQAQVMQLMQGEAEWQVPVSMPLTLEVLSEQLVTTQLRATRGNMVSFWTEGSAAVEPCCLLMNALPSPTAFVALLDGSWSARGWSQMQATVVESSHTITPTDNAAPFRMRSGGLTDTGRQRRSNQDALLERPEIGLWVVADGMGGHHDGDVASRMICDALAELPPFGNLEVGVQTVRARLQEVNVHLRRMALRAVNPVHCGSTVVVLLLRGQRCAILWAGDSRVYRLRAGQLLQLTTDHRWSDPNVAGADSHAITRAVGGTDTLDLDIYRDNVQLNDRYLLCSDGLTHEITDARIGVLCAQSSVDHCAHELVQAALDAGGSDNVSVVVVDVVAQE